MWSLLEEACKELDFQCAVVVGILGDVSVNSFRKLCVSAEVIETRARVKNMVNNYMHNECVLFTEVCPDGREDQA